jgi:Domain of unknown function (DUF333)
MLSSAARIICRERLPAPRPAVQPHIRRIREPISAAGSYGVCRLPNGRVVDEWTYFREHHRDGR